MLENPRVIFCHSWQGINYPGWQSIALHFVHLLHTQPGNFLASKPCTKYTFCIFQSKDFSSIKNEWFFYRKATKLKILSKFIYEDRINHQLLCVKLYENLGHLIRFRCIYRMQYSPNNLKASKITDKNTKGSFFP